MRKFILAAAFAIIAGPALAQNATCATRPTTDNSNACASTAFVHNYFPSGPITFPLAVTLGGTGTSTAFTAGSVVVAGSGGVYTQDNTGFFYNLSSHQLQLTNDILVGGYAVGPFTAPGSAVTLTTQEKFQQSISVLDFGAKCDGSTDDTAAFNAAEGAAISQGFWAIDIPAGHCKITGTINVTGPVYWRGKGMNVTIIDYTNPTDFLFAFQNDPSPYLGGGMSNLAIGYTGSGTATANVAIFNGTGVGELTFRDIKIANMYKGVVIDQGEAGNDWLDTINTSFSVNAAFEVRSSNGVSVSNFACFQANSGAISSNVGVCYNILNGNGVRITNCQSSYAASGVNVSPPSGSIVHDLYFLNCEFDASGNVGVSLDSTGGGDITDVFISNTRIGYTNNGSGGGRGLFIDGANTRGLTYNGGEIVKNITEGIKIVNGNNISFSGVNIMGNSVGGNATYDGVYITGGDNISFNNNSSTQFTDFTNDQRYGVNIDASFTGCIMANYNRLRWNVTGGLNNSSSTICDIIGNNQS